MADFFIAAAGHTRKKLRIFKKCRFVKFLVRVFEALDFSFGSCLPFHLVLRHRLALSNPGDGVIQHIIIIIISFTSQGNID